MLPVQGEPLLGIWLELCLRHGITEILINTHTHSAAVAQYVHEKSRGMSIRITEERELLGSAGTLYANRNWIAKEQEFWILYADVLTNADLSLMQGHHRQLKQRATMGVYRAPNPTQCGIVSLDDSGIVRVFVEKPERPTSDLAFSGLLIASPAILDCVPAQAPADIGFHVLPRLVGSMAAYLIPDYLLDIGTPEKYAFAQETWPGLKS